MISFLWLGGTVGTTPRHEAGSAPPMRGGDQPPPSICPPVKSNLVGGRRNNLRARPFWLQRNMGMDERRTLSLLGWIIGGLLGVFLALNAISLSDIATADAPATYTD